MLNFSSSFARGAILDAALAIFADKGFHGATMREIAVKAGISQGLLHHHFGNKDGLWKAVGDRTSEEFLDYVAGITDPVQGQQGIGHAVATYIRYWKQHPAAFRINLWRLLEGQTKERQARSKMLTAKSAPLMLRAQQAGEVRSDVPAGLLLCIAGAAAQFWLHSQMEIKDSLAAIGNAPVSEEEFIGYLMTMLSSTESSGPKAGKQRKPANSRRS
ncbi:MAG: TetR/AcrR family transcriptional regulator [Hyphomicrobiaceae bacterium]